MLVMVCVCDKVVLTCNVLHVDLFGTISMNINNNSTFESSN